MVVPSPTSPRVFQPQQYPFAVCVEAQAVNCPSEMEATVPGARPLPPKTAPGVLRDDVVPSPSCPLALSPQQNASAFTDTAQVAFEVALVATDNASQALATRTGTSRSVLVPSPSCPWKL